MYFASEDYISQWLGFGRVLCEVEIPDEAKVIVNDLSFRADKFILKPACAVCVLGHKLPVLDDYICVCTDVKKVSPSGRLSYTVQQNINGVIKFISNPIKHTNNYYRWCSKSLYNEGFQFKYGFNESKESNLLFTSAEFLYMKFPLQGRTLCRVEIPDGTAIEKVNSFEYKTDKLILHKACIRCDLPKICPEFTDLNQDLISAHKCTC